MYSLSIVRFGSSWLNATRPIIKGARRHNHIQHLLHPPIPPTIARRLPDRNSKYDWDSAGETISLLVGYISKECMGFISFSDARLFSATVRACRYCLRFCRAPNSSIVMRWSMSDLLRPCFNDHVYSGNVTWEHFCEHLK